MKFENAGRTIFERRKRKLHTIGFHGFTRDKSNRIHIGACKKSKKKKIDPACVTEN